MSHFKREMAARGVLRLVTTADNYAIGFWAQQAYTKPYFNPSPNTDPSHRLMGAAG